MWLFMKRQAQKAAYIHVPGVQLYTWRNLIMQSMSGKSTIARNAITENRQDPQW